METAKQARQRLQGTTAQEGRGDRHASAADVVRALPDAVRIEGKQQGAAETDERAEKALRLAADIIAAGALRAVLGGLNKG